MSVKAVSVYHNFLTTYLEVKRTSVEVLYGQISLMQSDVTYDESLASSPAPPRAARVPGLKPVQQLIPSEAHLPALSKPQIPTDWSWINALTLSFALAVGV